MKKLLLIASASLLLVGAGCAASTTSQTELNTGATANGQQTPPSNANAGTNVNANANAGATVQGNGVQVDVKAHAAANVAVAVTAGGTFSPAVVTIKAGDTVTWTNHATNPVWIASNPHPTHTDYPGFDSKAAIDPGKTYAFTFTKVGSWGYHNHLNPSVQGTVIVTE